MTQNWLITGASSGIGRALTKTLLERGHRVTATARALHRLDDLKVQYPDRLEVVSMELTDQHAIREAIQGAFSRMGHVDVVVSNAGYGLFGAGEEVSDEQIRHQIDTNLIGSIQVIRAALAPLRQQGGGHIIQVSSEGGQIAYPNFSVYHATKWGIEGFIESVAQEVAPFNISFTIAEPGPTNTDFAKALVTPPSMAIYDATPAGDVRRSIAEGSFQVKGDADRMARVIIESASSSPYPRRLVMGGDSYTSIRSALVSRIEELDAQKSIAYSTDSDCMGTDPSLQSSVTPRRSPGDSFH